MKFDVFIDKPSESLLEFLFFEKSSLALQSAVAAKLHTIPENLFDNPGERERATVELTKPL